MMETPVTRLDAAEMALRAVELEREAFRPQSGTDGRPFIEIMGEVQDLRATCHRYLEDVERSSVAIGHKGSDRYMLDACVLLNEAMAHGNPPRDLLAHAANAASLALSTTRKRR